MPRTAPIRIGGLFLAAASIWVSYSQQQPPPELQVIKVADDLHVLEGSGGNVAVYSTPEGVILVDDKFEQNAPQIVEKVKSITSAPIRYVLNTHQHGDHTGGNAKLMAQGVEAFVHDNARINMTKGSMPGIPRISFDNTITVALGGKTARAYHFGRGHTNGDAIIYFPAHRIIHTGDLFVAGAPFIDYANGGSGVAWTSTLDKALALDFDSVIPGHGPVMTRQQLIDWKKSFETVRSRLESAQKSGMSKETAAAQVKVDDLPGWGGASRFWPTRSFPGLWDELTKR